MMRPFTAGELARMQYTQGGSLQDICRRLVYVAGTVDQYGKPESRYTLGDELPCGFGPAPTSEAMGEAQVPTGAFVLRFAIDTVLDPRDRLRLAARFGVDITTIDYEIVGQPARGPSGLVVSVRLATTPTVLTV